MAATGNNPLALFPLALPRPLGSASGNSRPKTKYSYSQVIRFRPHPSTTIDPGKARSHRDFCANLCSELWRKRV